jgi:hypothetical protein
MKTRSMVWLPWLVFTLSLQACGGGGGKLTDPPPSPGLSPEEARRQADERSRAEREAEGGRLSPDELENLPTSGPAPKGPVEGPRSSRRPLDADELKLVREALLACGEAPATVQVTVEPGGVVFLSPGQRFPEADLRCYAEKLGALRLTRDVARTGTVTLP